MDYCDARGIGIKSTTLGTATILRSVAMLTKQQIEEIRARAEKATKGPWEVGYSEHTPSRDPMF